MTSLGTLLILAVISLAGGGSAVAWAARRVGSSRGRFWVGVRAVLLLAAASAGVSAAHAWATAPPEPPPGGFGPNSPYDRSLMADPPSPAAAAAVALGLLAAQLGLAFVVLKRAFRLRAKPALAPLGAYLAAAGAVLAVVVGVVRPHLTESYALPTWSMAPTIVPGDRFAVDKRAAPRRWDLVAYVTDPGPPPVLFVKRLVGLPGERLRFDGGTLYVNDEPTTAPPAVAGRYRAGCRATGTAGTPTGRRLCSVRPSTSSSGTTSTSPETRG